MTEIVQLSRRLGALYAFVILGAIAAVVTLFLWLLWLVAS